MPWTPYADWFFTAISITSLLLVLRPRSREFTSQACLPCTRKIEVRPDDPCGVTRSVDIAAP